MTKLSLKALQNLSSIYFTGLKPHLVASKAIELFGEKGAMDLATIGAFYGVDTFKYGHHIIVICTGCIKGKYKISELVERGLIAPKGIFFPAPSTSMYLNQITASMPHIPFLRASDNLCWKNKILIIKQTNSLLPLELQYPQAGSLPLPQKLRALHYEWYKDYCTKQGNTSLIDVFYKNQLIYANFLEKAPLPKTKEKLKVLESKLPSNSSNLFSDSNYTNYHDILEKIHFETECKKIKY